MLSPNAKAEIEAHFNALPDDLKKPTATEEQLRSFETKFGEIPADYRWVLFECGGGMVGSERIDDIQTLFQSHAKFRSESKLGGWKMKNVFGIGWDGSGNPFGIKELTNRVLVEDHNFGGIHELTPTFEEFLAKGCWV